MRFKHLFHVLRLRVRSLFRRNRVETELDEEMQYHLDRQIGEHIARGMSPEDAKSAALRAFGSVERLKEESRDARGLNFIDNLLQDLRYGLRTLGRTPGFAAVAVITLALGIGANTAMFSVLNGVVLRPLPYKDPSRLAFLWTDDPKHGVHEEGTGYSTYEDWRRESRAFEDMAVCTRGLQLRLTGGDDVERVKAERVSANFFSVLGVSPMLGRSFSRDEEQRTDIVVIGYGLWQRRFGGTGDAVGKTLEIEGRTTTVVGIMPKGFYFPSPDTQLWRPLAFELGERRRFTDMFRVIGRLRPAVTFSEVQTEMTAIGLRLAEAYPSTDEDFAGFAVNVVPVFDQMVSPTLQLALWILLGAVGFVLLIACANVANLLLARGTSREHEFALRSALGAQRTRLVRQILTETAALVVLGGLAGFALAAAALQALRAIAPPGIPRLDEVQLDIGVLIFTAGVSLLAGLLFGTVPAWKISQSDAGEALKSQGRSIGGGRRLSFANRLFVVVECALSIVLLAGAGLLVKSFIHLQDVNPGFKPGQVLLMRVTTPAVSREMMERIAGLPGVEAAGAISDFTFTRNPDQLITIEGRSTPKRPVTSDRVSPGFFQAMGVRLLSGRFFNEQDGRAKVAIINQTMAKTFWPNEDPIGKRFGHEGSNTVIGVIQDMRRRGLEREIVSEFYVRGIQPNMDLAIRTASDPLSVVPSVREAVRSFDRNAAISEVTTLEGRMQELDASRRFQTLLIAIFAGVALLLSAVGIYGVMHYAVTQRTHELGVRIALGARTSVILSLVIGEGLKAALTGVMLGLAGALALTRVMTHLLFEVSATDPAVFALVPTILIAVASLACCLPARRASKVDPIVALRHE